MMLGGPLSSSPLPSNALSSWEGLQISSWLPPPQIRHILVSHQLPLGGPVYFGVKELLPSWAGSVESGPTLPPFIPQILTANQTLQGKDSSYLVHGEGAKWPWSLRNVADGGSLPTPNLHPSRR